MADRHSSGLEGDLGATPSRPSATRSPRSRRADHMPMTAIRSPACRGDTCWPAGTPTTARRWPPASGGLATRAAAGWPSMPPAGWPPGWRPLALPAPLGRSRPRCAPAWSRPSAARKASPRRRRGAQGFGPACHRGVGWLWRRRADDGPPVLPGGAVSQGGGLPALPGPPPAPAPGEQRGHTAPRLTLPVHVRLVLWPPAGPEWTPRERRGRDLTEALAWRQLSLLAGQPDARAPLLRGDKTTPGQALPGCTPLVEAIHALCA
jgi:hypothetical protein